jgi:5-methylcytosine-specific restriction endonuclease McrA
VSAASAHGRPWQRIRTAVLNRDGWNCRHCGSHVHPRCLVNGCPTCAHVDHVLPRSKGGSDHPSNLVAACQRCNLARGDRMRHVPVPVAVNSRSW